MTIRSATTLSGLAALLATSIALLVAVDTAEAKSRGKTTSGPSVKSVNPAPKGTVKNMNEKERIRDAQKQLQEIK